jgi:hypothetical protein
MLSVLPEKTVLPTAITRHREHRQGQRPQQEPFLSVRAMTTWIFLIMVKHLLGDSEFRWGLERPGHLRMALRRPGVN